MLKLQNLHAQVLDQLGLRIVGSELPPGSRFAPEGQLAEEMGVSRTVAREVLKGLAARGMVTAKPRLGTRVTARTEWQLFDEDVMRWRFAQPDRIDALLQLMQLRLLVEPAAARMATEREDATLRATVQAAFAELEAAREDPPAWIAASARMHGAIMSGCGNDFISNLTRSLGAAVLASRNTTRPMLANIPQEEVAEGHDSAVDEGLAMYRAIAHAVRDGDGPGAEKATRQLLERTRELLDYMRGAA